MQSNLEEQISEQVKEKLMVGSIFYISDFKFQSTGEVRNKYCIILSNNDSYYYIIFLLTTSKVEKYVSKFTKEDYVLIPGGTGCFKEDTLVYIDNSNIYSNVSKDDFIKMTPNYLGKLESKYLDEILKKLNASKKIRPFLKSLIIK